MEGGSGLFLPVQAQRTCPHAQWKGGEDKADRRGEEWTGLEFTKSQRVHQVPESSGEQRKSEQTGYGAPATLSVKGLMMMMMKDLSHNLASQGSDMFPHPLPRHQRT